MPSFDVTTPKPRSCSSPDRSLLSNQVGNPNPLGVSNQTDAGQRCPNIAAVGMSRRHGGCHPIPWCVSYTPAVYLRGRITLRPQLHSNSPFGFMPPFLCLSHPEAVRTRYCKTFQCYSAAASSRDEYATRHSGFGLLPACLLMSWPGRSRLTVQVTHIPATTSRSATLEKVPIYPSRRT